MQSRSFVVTNKSNEDLEVVEVLPAPASDKQLPAVFLCHGFAYYKEEDGIFTGMADLLAAKGYAVYYFDFSGCGESQGDYSQTTLTKLVGDLESVCQTVVSYDYINGNQLSLIGQSFGTSVCIAAQFHAWQRIVLCGSFSQPYGLLSSLFPDFNETGMSSRPRSSGKITVIGPQFWPDLKQFDLEELISQHNCPILFIHGQLDTTVEPYRMQPLLAAAQKPIGPVMLEQSDHGLMPEREKAFQAVADFFPNAT